MTEQTQIVLNLDQALQSLIQLGWEQATIRQISRVLNSGRPDNLKIAEINEIVRASGGAA